ncbi:MAG: head-tail connector protein [Actinomycetota bacterium]
MPWSPDYLSAAELRSYLRIGDSDDDAQLERAIAGASRAVDRHCGRQFGQVDEAEERLYTPYRVRRAHRRRPRWAVPIDDLMTEDGLEVKNNETDTTISTYHLRPPNAVKRGEPWTELLLDSEAGTVIYGDDDEIAVTAKWGWDAVPEAVSEAVLLQAARLHSRRGAPFGVAGSPETGSELRLLARVDPDVAVLLEDFRRSWSVV